MSDEGNWDAESLGENSFLLPTEQDEGFFTLLGVHPCDAAVLRKEVSTYRVPLTDVEASHRIQALCRIMQATDTLLQKLVGYR
jgi:hypothetical protein